MMHIILAWVLTTAMFCMSIVWIMPLIDRLLSGIDDWYWRWRLGPHPKYRRPGAEHDGRP
jgi:hypothetical protein